MHFHETRKVWIYLITICELSRANELKNSTTDINMPECALNDNDNDNDNEIIFIAKWHTDHVQRTWVKNRSGRNNIHEIYKTWQRGLEAIVAYVPQYQLYQADCLGSAEQKQCRVLELFQYKTRSFMRMYTHIYTSYGKHVHIYVHVYTSIHRESIITIDASMY